MNPERNIEKRLRSFAKKRREQAGGEIDLHPANLRALQAEVARQFHRSAPRRSWLSGWKFRFAFAAGAMAVAVLSFLVMPALHPPDKAPQLASNRGEDRAREMSRKIATSGAVGSPTVALEPAAPTGDKLEQDRSLSIAKAISEKTGEVSVASANPRRNSAPRSNTGLSDESGVQAEKAPIANAPLKLIFQSGTPGLGSSQPRNQEEVDLPNAAIAVSGALGRRGGDGAADFESMVERSFVRVPWLPSEAAPTNIPVLAGFKLTRSGFRIQIVDADGSVYRGDLITNVATRSQLASAVETPNAPTLARPMARPVAFAFQVSGTNQTLNQVVVFAGELSSATNQIAPVAQAGEIGTDKSVQSDALAVPPHLTLRGTVTVGNRSQLLIRAEAVPAQPGTSGSNSGQ